MFYKKIICFTLLFFIVSVNVNAFSQSKEDSSLKINDLAPIFVLRNLDGEDIFLRNYCGELRQPWKNKLKHIVILSFFTTYCQPCLKEIPVLEKLTRKFQNKNLKIFLIDLKEGKELVRKFVNEKGFTLTVLLDKYGVVAKKYDVTTVPRIFIINREGRLIWITRGFVENLDEQLIQVLQDLFTEDINQK